MDAFVGVVVDLRREETRRSRARDETTTCNEDVLTDQESGQVDIAKILLRDAERNNLPFYPADRTRFLEWGLSEPSLW